MRVSKADRELVERGNNMINNACPPLHKLASGCPIPVPVGPVGAVNPCL